MTIIDPYIQSERTGTAMVVFADNSLGRIYINGGTLTSARYRNKEGMEALALCKAMPVQTLRFHEDTDIVRSRKILSSNDGVAESLGTDTPVPLDQPASAADQTAVTGKILSPANKRKLGVLLAEYIGPVAPLVMMDLPDEVDLETALSIVSREIDDTQRVAEFVAMAREML